MTKDQILAEIKRTAAANGGKALGIARFQQETGINTWDWQRHWPRYGDAVREAGCVQSEFVKGYEETELLGKYAKLARELGRLPVWSDLRVKAHSEADFPGPEAFNRRGGKAEWVKRLASFCQDKPEYQEVLRFCSEYVPRGKDDDSRATVCLSEIGFVYLTKSGRYYKIGKTNSAGRREYELALQMPERIVAIHTIETDDPTGIEAYWHNRFADKRKNGEWFDLSPADVAAFKKWRKIA
jgi:hypothetical protein